MKNNPKALYVHIPFCNHLCDYCDFCKMQYIPKFADDYLNALKIEIDSYQIKEVKTIYVGGGTPTSLNCKQLEFLLQILQPYNKKGVEYTFEANVETLNKEKLLLLKKYHVNRLSIGVESTDNEILKSINRHHSYEDVKLAMKLCREVGFDNINLDLILGLPNSNLDILRLDLSNLLALNPQHISTYSLLVNPNTKFFLNNVQEMNQDDARAEYDIVDKTLTDAGFIHYEVSNFGKPSYFSKHNFIYWNDEEYYGVGLGASGYINGIRYVNTRSINAYINHKFLLEQEKVEQQDDLIYYLMLRLRTINGIDIEEFKAKFGDDILIKCPKTIGKNIKNNILSIKDGRIIPSYEAMMIMDTIVLDLLNEYDKR